MSTLARDWRLLRSLNRRKRSGTAASRALFLVGCFPAILAGYLVLAFAFAEALPAPSLPPVPLLSLGVAIIWLRALGGALDGRGIVCTRDGLTQLLTGPVSSRVLVLRWAVGEALAGGLMLLGVFVFLAVLASPDRARLELLAAVLPAAVGLTLAATGVRGVLALALPGLPAAARRIAVTLCTVGQALCATALTGALLGFVWPGEIAPWADGVVAAAGFAAMPFAGLMQAGGTLALAALVVGGLAGWLLPVLLAPLAGAEMLLEAADRDLERRRAPAARARTSEGDAQGALLHGAGAPAWKIGREFAAQPGLFGPMTQWLLPVAAGIALAWFGPAWLPKQAALPATLIGALVLLAVPLGGRGSPGLASELEHPMWFLRYPGDRSRLLLAMLLPGVARLVFAAGLIGLPLAARIPGAFGPALAAWLATPVVVLAAHLSRAIVWLSWPPWNEQNAQTAVIEARALAIPPALGLGVAAVCWNGFGFPAWIACAAGAAPAVLMVRLQWKQALELWDRLEMLPRGG